MKKLLPAFSLLLIFSTAIFSGENKKFGESITLEEKTEISNILTSPDKFVGQKVLVEGTITDVCSDKGCWIELESSKEPGKIRVKVNDGEIVFPVEAKGKKATVEGEVYSIILEEEPLASTTEEAGCDEEKKAACAAAKGGPACRAKKHEVRKTYQIKGLGAVIEF